MIVEEPHWIELDNFNQADVFERELQDYNKRNGEPNIVVLITPHESKYKQFKNICYKQNTIS